MIACEGDALPGGGTLADSDKTLAASGRGVAFPGEDLNGTEAIYAWRAGRFARIATNGEANPAGGGFFVIQEPQVSMKGRTVVFGAGLEGANYSTAAFLALLE